MKQSKKQKVTAKKSTRSKTMTFSMKRYNNYNIFFMLERQRLLQSRQGAMAITIGGVAATDTADVGAVGSVEVSNRPRPSINDITEEENLLPPGAVRGYNNLVLPALCRRYADLPLSRTNWFKELLATKDSKRWHCKSHGLIPFADLARIIAKNYREVDDETKSFVNEVALRIALYNHDLESKDEDRMGLTQEQMKARQRQVMDVGKKTSLKYDDPSKNINNARGAGAMSTMMMTQRLPPAPLVHSTTMMPRTLSAHSTTMMTRPTLTASALPSPMAVSYDFELARLRREAEMAAFARIQLEQRITQLQMQQHYHQLRVQEQLRASREHAELLHILYRPENHLLTTSNNPGIMSNIMERGVPSGASNLSSKDNVDIQRRILGVIPEVWSTMIDNMKNELEPRR
jgi:hypothetical protein